MADDVVLNPGSAGSVIATDDIGGRHFQRVKLVHGADGVNAGDVATGNPLPAKEARGTVGTRSNVTATVDTQVLAANATRIRAIFYNDADKDFLLGAGTTTVSTTSFTVRLPPASVYAHDDFTGEMRGLFVAALGSGALRVTEIT